MKSLIFKALIIGLVLTISFSGSTQITDINGEVTPHSPEVNSLGKYIDHPVDLSRGITNISVPIYALTEGDLTLPISLSYHSQGIVVSSVSSWVGSGWNLMASGVVSRSVNGIQDDWNANGINLPKYGWYHSPQPLSALDYDKTSHEPSGYKLDSINMLLDGKIDKGPDVFSYSLPTGYTGKFYFDHNKEVRFIDNHDNLKVTVTTGSLGHFESFEILDLKGIRYVFSAKEYTANEHNITSLSNPFFEHAANAWHLTEMSNVNGTNKIFFEYEEEYYEYYTKNSCKVLTTNRNLVTIHASMTPAEALAAMAANQACQQDDYCAPYLKIHVKGKRLSKISALVNNIEIDFNSSTRPDIGLVGSAERLDDISIAFPSGKCIKHKFQYYNLRDNAAPGPTKITRFNLESLQKSTCNNTIVEPPYKFYYNDSIKNGHLFFPKRNSSAIDHWGYYNGQNQNAVNTPNIPTSELYDQFQNLIGVPATSNNRESKEETMLLGMLNKINHPLGAVDTFTFEANRVSGYEYWDSREVFQFNYDNCGINLPPAEYYHTMTSEQIQHAKYDLLVKACPSSGPGSQTYTIQLEFLDQSYATIRNPITVSETNPGTFQGTRRADLSSILSSYINAGDVVRFKLSVIGSSNAEAKFKMYYHRKINSPQAKVGGLRVKKIKTIHDGIVSVKEFNYNTNGGASYVSSGRLVQFPSYVGAYESFGSVGQELDISNQDHSNFSLSSVDGRHICYEEVRENYSDGSYKLNYFRKGQDPIPLNFNHAYANHYTPIDANKGLLDSSKVYNSNGMLVLDEAFEYAIYSESMTSESDKLPFDYSVMVCENLNRDLLGGLLPHYPALVVSLYNPRSSYSKLTKTKKITYNELGQEPLVDIGKITYDSHRNISEQTQWRETDGDVTLNGEDHAITKNFYLYDGVGFGTGATTVEAFMQTKNLVGVPYKTVNKQKIGSGSYKLTSGSKVEYTLNSGKLVLEKTYGLQHGVFYPVNKVLTWDYRGKPVNVKAYKIGANINSSMLDDNLTKNFWVQDKLVRREYTSDHGVQSTVYGYNTDDMLTSITDHNNQIIAYKYDDLNRLEIISKGKAVGETDFRQWTTIDYNYKLNAAGNFVSGANNEIISTQHFLSSGSNAVPNQITKSILDDYGRDKSKVKLAYAPDGTDAIMNSQIYDPLGRLASTMTIGEGISSNTYENAATNRLLSRIEPFGSTKFSYGHNARSLIINGKTYLAGTLSKQKVVDTDGNQTIVYKDFIDREIQIIRPVTINGSLQYAKTSKSYNDYNQIEQITPPSGSSYLYTYNDRGMLISKKVPTELFAQQIYYDVFGRQLAVKDANDNIIAIKYDDLGREIEKGEISSISHIDQLNHIANIPTSIEKIHHTTSYQETPGGNPMDWIENESEVNMSTINNPSPIFYNTDYIHDNIGRVIRIEKDNHKGGLEVIRNYYNNANIVYKEETDHNKSNITFAPEVNVVKDFTFDNGLRQTDTYLQISGISGTQHTSNLVYNNELQLIQKNLQETIPGEFLQSIDFNYDAAGRLVQINDLADVNNEDCLADNYCDIHLSIDTIQVGGILQAEIQSINYLDPVTGETNIPGISFPYTLDFSTKTALINGIENWLNTAGYKHDEVMINDSLNLMVIIQSNAPITNLAQLTQTHTAIVANCCGGVESTDLFAEKINYGTLGTTINSIEWSTTCNEYSKYAYEYDELKRMTAANYYSKSAIGDNWATPGLGGVYGVSVEYDLLGNISSLKRNGKVNGSIVKIDNLRYDYAGSTGRLAHITESTGVNYNNYGQKGNTSYMYDANGNVTIEQSKGIALDYNVFDLPSSISKTTSGDNIQNVYSGKQNRLQKILTVGGSQRIKDYIVNFEYVTENGTTQLEAAYFDFGRVLFFNGQTIMEFAIHDHLGTPRVYFTDRDNNNIITKADILQEVHTYPFGLEMNEMASNTIGQENAYQYNGKEIDEELGLEWYNYGARFYDPAIARFHTVDALADHKKQVDKSTYAYAWNNPVSLVDLDGNCPDCEEEEGEEEEEGKEEQTDPIIKANHQFKIYEFKIDDERKVTIKIGTDGNGDVKITVDISADIGSPAGGIFVSPKIMVGATELKGGGYRFSVGGEIKFGTRTPKNQYAGLEAYGTVGVEGSFVLDENFGFSEGDFGMKDVKTGVKGKFLTYEGSIEINLSETGRQMVEAGKVNKIHNERVWYDFQRTDWNNGWNLMKLFKY